MIFTPRKALLPSLIAMSLGLAGCGGSSTEDNATGGTLTQGIVTGFGSVYVNGIKFNTDRAAFNVDDDDNSAQGALKVGMMVTVNGTINDDGKTGTAHKIHYDNDVEGPVSSLVVLETSPSEADPNVLVAVAIEVEILGQTVIINSDTVLSTDQDHALGLEDIEEGDILEVSGMMDAEGNIIATLVELQEEADPADYEYEIRGPVAALNTEEMAFILRGFRIRYDDATEFDDLSPETLRNGRWVEVKGHLNEDSDALIAREIESEDPGFTVDLGDSDNYKAELEGLIADYDPEAMTFNLQGMPVDYSEVDEIEPEGAQLDNDMRVKVEGQVVDGVIIAKEIKVLTEYRSIEIQAPVVAVDDSLSIDASATLVTLSVFGQEMTVRVNQQTELDTEYPENEMGGDTSDDSMTDDGSTDDGSTDDGSTDGGSADDGSTDDEATDDTDVIGQDLVGRMVRVKALMSGSDEPVLNAIELETTDDTAVKLLAPVSGFRMDGQQVLVEVLGQEFDVSGAEKITGNGGSHPMPPQSWNMTHSHPFVQFIDDDADGEIDRFRKVSDDEDENDEDESDDDDDDEGDEDGKGDEDQPMGS